MNIGYHVSIAGGLPKVFGEAKLLACDVIQFFVSNPQIWETRVPSEEEIKEFKELHKKSGIKDILVHSAYLPNPSTPRKTLWAVTMKKMKEEIEIAEKIGASGYNVHPGSNPNTKDGIATAIRSFNRLAELTDSYQTKIIIENDAGAGNRIGDTVEELAVIWQNLTPKNRFGFTLDTCHLFVSGIDIRKQEVLEKVLDDFDKQIGLEYLWYVHLNDSKYDLGSRRDIHEHIGKGFIGLEPFRYIVNHPKLKNKNFILETPHKGNLEKEIKNIKNLQL